ncbi:MAG: porin family protein [Proteobacteria bacterium]|nr:porin family protein [Pseudomonadota bacterium]MBU1715638.1 porin family protein [Pseudomonadota bacterium]
MKKSSVMTIVLATTLTGIITPAFAAENPANYLMIKAGVYSPSSSHDLNDFNGGSRTRLDSETGFAGEIAAGHYFLPMVALELGAGYFQSEGSAAAQPGETKLKVVPVTLSGKVLLPLGMFEPYGLLGVGAYITDLDVSGNTGNFSGSSETSFGLHAGGGVNLNFNKEMFVGLEGKYLWSKPSFGGQDIDLDGFITTVNLGFRY